MARYSLSDRTSHVSKSTAIRLVTLGEYKHDGCRKNHLIRLTMAERLEARRIQREIQAEINSQPRAAGTLPPFDVRGVRFHEPTGWRWRLEHRMVNFRNI